MAAKSSKVLLDQPSKPCFPESLLVGGEQPAGVTRGRKPAAAAAAVIGGSEPKPLTAAVPRSQFLEKVKDFLGLMAEANEKLEHEVQSSSRADHDVEVLSGNEKGYIEMDLLLGVADLRTAEAVAAAEAAMCGFRPCTTSSSSSSSSDIDDDSDQDEASRRSDERSKRPKIVVLDKSAD
ncbi:hypothetical protein B296_00003178 [Ensete ventricosum]|uniref:Uncharacterized protein n=1 Tax=Ensete ventricosum TaxID=4639 RepID=A0A427B9K0_ENSVE|nr:hypothetical protein B296_00003178 [Ensete ventricosum]